MKRLLQIAFFSVLASSMVAVTACQSTGGNTTPATSTSVPYQSGSMPSFSSIVSKVIPSIVYIYVETDKVDSNGDPVNAAGSGVILRSDGYILTNRHVVEGAKTVEVTLENLRSYTASKVMVDDVVDMAVVKIDKTGLQALPMANPDSVNVGDWVVAIGHALGIAPVQGGPTVTDGIVSSLGRSFTIDTTQYYDVIQTSAAINPGNSGGALVNAYGELVGINSATVSGAENIGFAISVGTAKHVFDDLVQYGKGMHPFLGVQARDVSAQNARSQHVPLESAFVDYVESGSPAEDAGLRANDAVISLGGEKIESAADLVKVLWRHDPGDSVVLVYSHRGLEVTKTIKLADRPDSGSGI